MRILTICGIGDIHWVMLKMESYIEQNCKGTIPEITIWNFDGRPRADGFDINPCAVDWLKSVGKYREPSKIDAMSFWDSLEHIHNPTALLDNIKTYAFISCPVYRDKEHILGSKHFRPDEHCWYWTKTGLMAFMSNFGFTLVEFTNVETFLGREDIGSFVFKRKL